jgi:hypothetical protein
MSADLYRVSHMASATITAPPSTKTLDHRTIRMLRVNFLSNHSQYGCTAGEARRSREEMALNGLPRSRKCNVNMKTCGFFGCQKAGIEQMNHCEKRRRSYFIASSNETSIYITGLIQRPLHTVRRFLLCLQYCSVAPMTLAFAIFSTSQDTIL